MDFREIGTNRAGYRGIWMNLREANNCTFHSILVVYTCIISDFRARSNSPYRIVNDKSMTKFGFELYSTAFFCYDSAEGRWNGWNGTMKQVVHFAFG
jgi:hypothetical protein